MLSETLDVKTFKALGMGENSFPRRPMEKIIIDKGGMINEEKKKIFRKEVAEFFDHSDNARRNDAGS